MKSLGPPQSGKLGDKVASRNHYGPYEHKHFVPEKAPSSRQVDTREAWGILAAAWDELTEAQRELWRRHAHETPSRRRLGHSHWLIGSVLYQKLNFPRVKIGLPPLEAPSRRPSFPPNPVSELLVVRTGRGLRLMVRVSRPPTQYTLVYGSPPLKAGRASCSTFCYLGLLPEPRNGLCDITQLYCKRYGAPPLNSKLFIRTRQQIEGWQDMPHTSDVLIPRSPWAAPKAPRGHKTPKKPIE